MPTALVYLVCKHLVFNKRQQCDSLAFFIMVFLQGCKATCCQCRTVWAWCWRGFACMDRSRPPGVAGVVPKALAAELVHRGVQGATPPAQHRQVRLQRPVRSFLYQSTLVAQMLRDARGKSGTQICMLPLSTSLHTRRPDFSDRSICVLDIHTAKTCLWSHRSERTTQCS